MDDQYGGHDEDPAPLHGRNARTFDAVSNSYCLVYVREADWREIMVDVPSNDIAGRVRTRREVRPACAVQTVQCNIFTATWRQDLRACVHKLSMLPSKQTPCAWMGPSQQRICACLEEDACCNLHKGMCCMPLLCR